MTTGRINQVSTFSRRAVLSLQGVWPLFKMHARQGRPLLAWCFVSNEQTFIINLNAQLPDHCKAYTDTLYANLWCTTLAGLPPYTDHLDDPHHQTEKVTIKIFYYTTTSGDWQLYSWCSPYSQGEPGKAYASILPHLLIFPREQSQGFRLSKHWKFLGHVPSKMLESLKCRRSTNQPRWEGDFIHQQVSDWLAKMRLFTYFIPIG